MMTFAGLLLVLCVCAIVIGLKVPALALVGIVARSVLVAVAAWAIWWGLLFLQVVRIDPLMRRLGLDRLEPPWIALIFFGPPLAAAVAFGLVAAWRVRTSDRIARIACLMRMSTRRLRQPRPRRRR
jgi:hypothetical protein